MLNRMLALFAALIFIAIVAASAVHISKNGMRGAMRRMTSEQEKEVRDAENPRYIDLGKFRAATKADSAGNRSVITFSASLSYDTENTELFEEISLNSYKIKPILTDYFREMTKAELLEKGETIVKAEILSRINRTLVLGKADGIFFESFQYID